MTTAVDDGPTVDDIDEGARRKKKIGATAWIIAIGLALAIAPAASLGFGSAAVPFGEAFAILAAKGLGIGDISQWDPSVVAIIWLNRVPRILAAVGVGCILGIAGVAMQAVIRNPLAEPYVLGISSGASTGAAASIILIGASGAFAVGSSAFIGAIVATVLVLWLGSGRAGSTLRLVLAGVAIGFMFQAATNLIVVSANDAETAQSVVFWSLGSLTRPDMGQGIMLIIAAAVLSVGLWFAGPYLDALASGDNTCVAVGLNPNVLRVLILVPVSAGVALAVSQTGGIGFIGLVVPHLMRPLVGYSHRGLVAGTALASALFLLVTDTVARTVLAPVEIPIGIITALLGAPLLVALTRRMV